MKRIRIWRQNFNWRMFLVRILVNALALLFTALILRNVYFVDRSFLNWLWLALMLGLLNAFIKPAIAFLTLRFIFATGGLVLALINGLILWLLSRLFPNLLAVDTIISALLGGLVLGLASAFLEALLGLNPPIVAEKYPEIRERIKDRQFFRTPMVPTRMAARSLPAAGELEAGTQVESAALPDLPRRDARPLNQAEPALDEDEAKLPSTDTKPEA